MSKNKGIKMGMLISKHLRDISIEETELVKNEDGQDVMATKAEMLARIIWKYALGFEEEKSVVIDGKLEKRTEVKKPCLAYINLIINRLEGKSEADKGTSDNNLKRRVSEEAASRINESTEK